MSLSYRLTIVKVEANPNYNEAAEARRYINEPREQSHLETRQMEVNINEAEFDCLKQALLKVWK